MIALIVLLVCLVGAIAADWSTLEPGARIGFGALGALAAFMVMRAERARRDSTSGQIDVFRFSRDIGFTLVGLIDGFVVVFALQLGVPTVGLVIVGAGIAVAGHLLIRGHERRLRAISDT